MNNEKDIKHLSMEPLVNLIWEEEILDNIETIEPFMITARCSCGTPACGCFAAPFC